MPMKGRSALSIVFDVSGITLIIIGIITVKVAQQPLAEILAGVLATMGFGLIAGAKYVWNYKRSIINIIIRSNYIIYVLKEKCIDIFSFSFI